MKRNLQNLSDGTYSNSLVSTLDSLLFWNDVTNFHRWMITLWKKHAQNHIMCGVELINNSQRLWYWYCALIGIYGCHYNHSTRRENHENSFVAREEGSMIDILHPTWKGNSLCQSWGYQQSTWRGSTVNTSQSTWTITQPTITGTGFQLVYLDIE